MNMKNAKYFKIDKIVIFVILTIAAISCTQLDDTSYNSIISKEFTPSTTDLAALTGAPYVNWRQLLLEWNCLYRAEECSADEEVIPERPNGWVDAGVYRRLHEHKWTTDDDVVINVWTDAYQGITNCNRIIYQVRDSIIPVAAKDTTSLIAEMGLLRASFYWVLVNYYGNVPIITKFNLPNGYLPTQNSRQEVFSFIIQQIKNNISLVSTANDEQTYGRFNKWAGLALLAKVYLNAEIYTGTPEWDKCIDVCDTIINSGLFQLENNQKNVFATDNENSNEIIFALPFDSKYVTDWNAFDIHMQTLEPENQATYNLQSTPWGGICATPQFINTFDHDDSRYKDNYIKGQQYTAAGDSIWGTLGLYSGKPLSYVNYVPGIDYSEEVDGFRLGKFEIAMGSQAQLDNDFPLFRYADVLMMKAECLLRTGHEDEAAEIVTEIRERDFKSAPEKATVTGEDLLKGSSYDYGLRNHLDSTEEGGLDIQYGRFLDELGWEFNQEGRRRTDMIRFGVFTKKSWLSHSPNGNYRDLFPIPRTELDKNSNLTQNPGY